MAEIERDKKNRYRQKEIVGKRGIEIQRWKERDEIEIEKEGQK